VFRSADCEGGRGLLNNYKSLCNKIINIAMVALKWKRARSTLRELLLEYLDGPSPRIEFTISTSAGQYGTGKTKFPNSLLESWLENDLDLYCGALFLSFGLLILACFAFISTEDDIDDAKGSGSFLKAFAEDSIYYSQLAASTLLTTSSFAGIWIVRRRQFACLRDVDNVKRREIKRFLKSMGQSPADTGAANTTSASYTGDQQSCNRPYHEVSRSIRCDSSTSASPPFFNVDTAKLPGTSLTDIYPVYRLYSDGGQGSWSRVPTLLLVKGDHVALQVGDIAPAQCRILNDGGYAAAGGYEVAGGDRITSESFGIQQTGPLPKGRTLLPRGSQRLLDLCNRLRIFVLLESPLDEYLRRPLGELS